MAGVRLRAVAALLIGVAGVTAGRRASAGPIAPPTAWTPDVREQSAADGHVGYIYFRDDAAPPALDAWVPSLGRGDAALSTVVTQTRAAGDRAAIARAAIDAFYAAADGEIIERSERALDDRRQVEATVRWRDARATHLAKVVLAGDARRLVAVTAACDAAPAAADALAACEAALGSLDAGIAAADRAPLRLLAPVATPPATTATPAAPPASMSPAPSMSAAPLPRLPATISDGGHLPMPTVVVPDEPRRSDPRPVYVGAGLLALAAVFWWNRKRRDALARADERAGAPAGAPGTPDEPDDDSDALHAAARGASAKEPDADEP